MGGGGAGQEISAVLSCQLTRRHCRPGRHVRNVPGLSGNLSLCSIPWGIWKRKSSLLLWRGQDSSVLKDLLELSGSRLLDTQDFSWTWLSTRLMTPWNQQLWLILIKTWVLKVDILNILCQSSLIFTIFTKSHWSWKAFNLNSWFLLIAGQFFGTFNVTNLSTKSFRKLKITDKLLFGDYTKLPQLHKEPSAKISPDKRFLEIFSYDRSGVLQVVLQRANLRTGGEEDHKEVDQNMFHLQLSQLVGVAVLLFAM